MQTQKVGIKVIVSIFYGRRIPTEVLFLCQRKTKSTYRLSLGNSGYFQEILFVKKSANILECRKKKKKKPKCQLFFLVGNNFNSSEDSLTIVYTEDGLILLPTKEKVSKCNIKGMAVGL